MSMRRNEWIDPYYVQISKKKAALICSISVTELDRRRVNDPDCPQGFKDGVARSAPVKFRLSDIYAYSETLMERATKEVQGGA